MDIIDQKNRMISGYILKLNVSMEAPRLEPMDQTNRRISGSILT